MKSSNEVDKGFNLTGKRMGMINKKSKNKKLNLAKSIKSLVILIAQFQLVDSVAVFLWRHAIKKDLREI